MIKQFIFQNLGGGGKKINNAWMSYLGTWAGNYPQELQKALTTGLFHIHCDYEPQSVERTLLYVTYTFKVTPKSGTAKTISRTKMPVYVNVDSIDDSFVNDKLKNNDIFFTEDLGYSINQIQKVELINWSITPLEEDIYKYVIKSNSFYKDNIVRNTVWNVSLYSDYSNPGWIGQVKFYLHNSSTEDTLYSPTTFGNGKQDLQVTVSYLNYTSSFGDQLRINVDLYTENWRAPYTYEGKLLPSAITVNSYNENGYIMTNLSDNLETYIPAKGSWGYTDRIPPYLDDTDYGSCVTINTQGLWDNAR